MKKNAIGRHRQTLRDNQPACPVWCKRHETVDQGHADEALIHWSRKRRLAGSEVRLQRWDNLASGRAGAVQILLDGEFLTRSQARAQADALIVLAGLLTSAADGEL